jgi:hypothetical protein
VTKLRVGPWVVEQETPEGTIAIIFVDGGKQTAIKNVCPEELDLLRQMLIAFASLSDVAL